MSDKAETSCPLAHSDCPISEELHALHKRIDSLSDQLRIDEQTGLFNKRHLKLALQTEMERTRRNKQPTSLVMFDLDHFKSVNDTYGHPVGDLVLTTVAKAVKDTVRMLDVPCRYGGEEFVVILPSTPLLTATHVAERLREAIAKQNIPLQPPVEGKTNLAVTSSFGVAGFADIQDESIERFIDRADKQLYRAKKNGRNQVAFEPMGQKQKSQVSSEERDALFSAMNYPEPKDVPQPGTSKLKH